MKEIRKIISEELQHLFEEEGEAEAEAEEMFKHVPELSDPKLLRQYAMHWQKVATELNFFYNGVADNVNSAELSPEQKLDEIRQLLKRYASI